MDTLPGVGWKLRERLADKGIETVADVLVSLFSMEGGDAS